MSEIAVNEKSAGVAEFSGPFVPPAPVETGVDLAGWAADLQAAAQLGTALSQTDFAPSSYRNKPEQAAAAILAGKSLGLDPMNSLQQIFVVQGRPALYARTMHALVLQAGHKVERVAATNASVTVRARRKDHAEWTEFTWDIERAKLAGYLSNKKYLSDPIAMLTAKALAEACRVIAPDVLTGISSTSAEEVELEDLGENPAPAPAPAHHGGGTASEKLRRATTTAPAPEPEQQDWYGLADAADGDTDTLKNLWSAAQAAGTDQATLDYIKGKAN